MRTIPLLLLLVAACGSSDPSGEPILGGTLTGKVNGDSFTAKAGFAGVHGDDNKPIIGIGESGLDCDYDPQASEIHGLGVLITELQYTTDPQPNDPFVEVYKFTSSQYQLGGSNGTLTLTDVNESSVAGTLDFEYDTSDGDIYEAHGDFVVLRCP